MKPKVYIASSIKGMAIAEAIKHLLSNDAEITVWTEVAFNISHTPLNYYMNAISRSDFGVFILTPDDITRSKDKDTSIMKDNLIIEMGMSIGKLGASSTFLIVPKGEWVSSISPEILRVPLAIFDSAKSDQDLLAALAPTCEQIGRSVQFLSKLKSGGTVTVVGSTLTAGRDIYIVGQANLRSIVPDRVFISYSHKDKIWLERLKTMLMPLIWKDKVLVWDDIRIRPGTKWKEEIRQAILLAKVAILLVSPNFLASDFIAQHELPQLLRASNNKSLTIIWALLSACFYEKTDIAKYQAAHNISKPLDALTPAKRNQELYNICKGIDEALFENKKADS